IWQRPRHTLAVDEKRWCLHNASPLSRLGRRKQRGDVPAARQAGPKFRHVEMRLRSQREQAGRREPPSVLAPLIPVEKLAVLPELSLVLRTERRQGGANRLRAEKRHGVPDQPGLARSDVGGEDLGFGLAHERTAEGTLKVSKLLDDNPRAGGTDERGAVGRRANFDPG